MTDRRYHFPWFSGIRFEQWHNFFRFEDTEVPHVHASDDKICYPLYNETPVLTLVSLLH
jgi:hypothetical protein